MQEFVFSLRSFALCSPFTGCLPGFDAARNAVWDDNADADSWLPDTSFIPKKKFRRLSRLSKMALYTAHHASRGLLDRERLGPPIFCSNHGEFNHTVNVLMAVQDSALVSPMDFSYSVHNTAQGLFSIMREDDTPATAISSRDGCVENAFIKAFAQLQGGDDAVMVVYHDDVLPDIYDPLLRESQAPLSFAAVLCKGDVGHGGIKLSYGPGEVTGRRNTAHCNQHEMNLARLLIGDGGACEFNRGRLKWAWHYDPA